MTKDEAEAIILQHTRTVLSMLPSDEWCETARSVSYEIMKLSGAKKSESGSYRLAEVAKALSSVLHTDPEDERIVAEAIAARMR